MSREQGHSDGTPPAVEARERAAYQHYWNSPRFAARRARDLAERAEALRHMPDLAAALRAGADRWAARAKELGA